MAAWAPNRNQRTPSAPSPRARSARTSATGCGDEDTGGAIDQALERDVVSQVFLALRLRRPVRIDLPHVDPESLGRFERGQWVSRQLTRPVRLLEGLGHRPRAMGVGAQIVVAHTSSIAALVRGRRMVYS